jgi:uncharacterized protein YjiK
MGGRTETLLADPSPDAGPAGGKADSPVQVQPLDIDHQGTVPLAEVSGLALRTWNGQRELLAIGDSEQALVSAVLPSSVKPSTLLFERHELGELVPGGPPSQWEAVTADPSGRVFVLEEDPGAVFVFSPALDALQHLFELHVSAEGPAWQQELAADWASEPNSRGEGLCLGETGHLFVLKEKHGPAIIEFAPAGDEPVGLFGPLQDPFPMPTGTHSVLVPIRLWKFADSARDALPDMSDLFIDGGGTLYVVSGAGRTLGRIRESLDPGATGKLHLDAAWKMPKTIANPEGLVLLDDEEPWVASDSAGPLNLFELKRVAP